MRVDMFRPLCLPDDDDLTLDLVEERTGTVVGWGLDTVYYRDWSESGGCEIVQGEIDKSSLPTKLKYIDLK